MRVVLTGSRGGIGQVIKETLKSQDINVIELTSDKLDLKNKFNLNLDSSLDLGKIDGLIHCAGINELASYKQTCRESAKPIMDVNTFSFVELCSQLQFEPSSNIIAIGSIYSIATKENRIQYAMSKHALHGAIKTLAIEMAPHKVNLISPGFVDTALTRKNNDKDRINELQQKTPLGLTDSQDVASLCLYLLTKNNCITGQNLIVDSGYSLVGI